VEEAEGDYEKRSWETRETRSPRRVQKSKRVNAHTHYEKLAYMREQLTAMGKTLDKYNYADFLLASVPSSHKPAIRRQLTNDRRVWKPHLRPKEALSSTTPPEKRTFGCFDCKKRGHLKADCWAKGK
jgi:hypothetical protein